MSLYRHCFVTVSSLFCRRFCSELRHTEHAHLLHPCLPHYLDYLIDMSGDSPDYLLPLSLEALQLVAQVSQVCQGLYRCVSTLLVLRDYNCTKQNFILSSISFSVFPFADFSRALGTVRCSDSGCGYRCLLEVLTWLVCGSSGHVT